MSKNDNSKNKKNIFNVILGLPKKIIITIGILLVVGIGFVLVKTSKGGIFSTVSTSSLQKVFEISELDTIEYAYNAVATKYTKDKDPKYYVAYEGKVRAGIDFSKIDIKVDKENKKVTLTIPEIIITDVTVDSNSMDYIFVKDKYETESVHYESLTLCKEDLQNRIEKEELFYETAKENTKLAIEALIKPWIESVDDEYKVEIN